MNITTNPITLTPEEFALVFAPVPGHEPTRTELLTAALIRAGLRASDHLAEEDCGFTNEDAPTLDYQALGIKKHTAERVIASVGLSCYSDKALGPLLIITGFQQGRAMRRTLMSKAFSNSLKADGIPAGMFYLANNAGRVF